MKTLASDSVILILYFSYHDRRIDFSRYVQMFDSAIAKIDQHLKDSNQNTQHLSDKKDLLKSISSIIKNMAENYYFNSNDQTAVSMLEYERNIVIKLMKSRRRKVPVRNSQSSDESKHRFRHSKLCSNLPEVGRYLQTTSGWRNK